jgi:hypothetical protein
MRDAQEGTGAGRGEDVGIRKWRAACGLAMARVEERAV